MTPVERLRLAYPGTRLFGLTAERGRQGGTTFGWRDYATGARGTLGTAAGLDAVALGAALLTELRVLRKAAAKKPPQKDERKNLLVKKAGA